MGLNYENLNDRIRKFMLKEIELDISKDNVYISPRLTEESNDQYQCILKNAVLEHDDNWLANELRNARCLKEREKRKKPDGGYSLVKVPINAPETLAEGEFNRFYIRGLCRAAIEDGIQELQIYRGKDVDQPRPESEAMIGMMIDAKKLLEDLRLSPGEGPALGVPSGPNSGLTVRLL
jgi:hypothetical protein